MQGMAVGRAVDLTVLNGYDELINELEEMFEIKGQLYPRNQWEIVFTDDEGDMMLMGDDPWQYVCYLLHYTLLFFLSGQMTILPFLLLSHAHTNVNLLNNDICLYSE